MESLNSIGVPVSDEEAKAEAKRLLLGALDSPTESQAETLARQWIKQAMVIASARWSAQLEAAKGLLRSAEALLDPSRGTGDVQVRYQLVGQARDLITVAEAVKEVGKLISVESARRISQTRFLDARLGPEPTTMLPWTGQNQPRI